MTRKTPSDPRELIAFVCIMLFLFFLIGSGLIIHFYG